MCSEIINMFHSKQRGLRNILVIFFIFFNDIIYKTVKF